MDQARGLQDESGRGVGDNVVRPRLLYVDAVVDEPISIEGSGRALRAYVVAVHVAEPREALRKRIIPPDVGTGKQHREHDEQPGGGQ